MKKLVATKVECTFRPPERALQSLREAGRAVEGVFKDIAKWIDEHVDTEEGRHEVKGIVEGRFIEDSIRTSTGQIIVVRAVEPSLHVPDRFRAVDNWATQHGGLAGFPNFQQADYGQGVVYGTLLFPGQNMTRLDIPASELAEGVEERFRAVDEWAIHHGCLAGFPNFHQANYGRGVVYGVLLFSGQDVVRMDIPAAELAVGVEERFRAVDEWAIRHGYIGGFPNFQQADYGQGVVYGCILLKPGIAQRLDVHNLELFPKQIRVEIRERPATEPDPPPSRWSFSDV